MHQNAETIGAAAAKSAPPVTVAGMTLAGYPLSDWLLILTLLYTLMQIVFLARRMSNARRKKEDERDPACAADCAALRRQRTEREWP